MVLWVHQKMYTIGFYFCIHQKQQSSNTILYIETPKDINDDASLFTDIHLILCYVYIFILCLVVWIDLFHVSTFIVVFTRSLLSNSMELCTSESRDLNTNK